MHDEGAGVPAAVRSREVRLPDGRALTVRAVTPADVDGLRALYEGLSVEDQHARFFSVYHPSVDFLDHATRVCETGGFGLVAVVADGPDGGERVVGEAGYVLLPDGDGEFAITVARDWRGWLGAYLLDALVQAAASRGTPNLQADILLENRPMLALVRARGYATLDHPDYAVVRVTIGTAGRTPSWPRTRRGPRVLVEVPGARWHAEAALRAAGFDVVACPGPPPGEDARCPALAGEPCPLATGADAIVFALRSDDASALGVLAAHARLRPSVPLCVEGLHPTGDTPVVAAGTVVLTHEMPDDEIVAALRRVTGAARSARSA